jgi:DNA-directed RNA polymerase specialized sigma24 family protein
VCRSLAKRTIQLAELDGLTKVTRRPRSGRKHLTNLITIIRAEWLDWLNKGNRRAHAVTSCTRAKPDFQRPRGVQKNPPRAQSFITGVVLRRDTAEVKRE